MKLVEMRPVLVNLGRIHFYNSNLKRSLDNATNRNLSSGKKCNRHKICRFNVNRSCKGHFSSCSKVHKTQRCDQKYTTNDVKITKLQVCLIMSMYTSKKN